MGVAPYPFYRAGCHIHALASHLPSQLMVRTRRKWRMRAPSQRQVRGLGIAPARCSTGTARSRGGTTRCAHLRYIRDGLMASRLDFPADGPAGLLAGGPPGCRQLRQRRPGPGRRPSRRWLQSPPSRITGWARCGRRRSADDSARDTGLRGLTVTAGPRRRHGPAATGSNAPATSRTRRGFGAGRRCRSNR
jgi:hypothetical protein